MNRFDKEAEDYLRQANEAKNDLERKLLLNMFVLRRVEAGRELERRAHLSVVPPVRESRVGLTKEELQLIGGSDASAVVGMNPYKTRVDLFARIVEGREDPTTEAMWRGTLLEPVIRAMAERKLGMVFRGPRKYRIADWGRASLDDVLEAADGTEEVAEFKSVNGFAAAQYGEEGTDEVPREHLCQTQMYMGVSGMKRAHLVALIGTDDLRHYVIESDTELQAMLFEACERFHQEHVLTGVPPEVDGSDSCARWLEERYPRSNGALLPATPEAIEWAKKLRIAREARKAAELVEKEARNHLVALIGEADGMEGPDFKLSYRLSKGKPTVDWKAVAFEAGIPPERIAAHTTHKPFRVFKPTFPGVSDE